MVLVSKFKFGDNVYRVNSTSIWQVKEVVNGGETYIGTSILKFNKGNTEEFDCWCCHATEENYEQLQATFPEMKFEKPE